MHLAVLCLRRRREDQKLILLHAGGCLHESLWYGGSSVDIWHCLIMALLPCWSRPGRPHAIHAPVTYQKHVEEGIQRDAILFSIPVTVTRFLGAVLCNQLREQSYSQVLKTFASQLCKDNAAVLSNWLALYRFGSGGSADIHQD